MWTYDRVQIPSSYIENKEDTLVVNVELPGVKKQDISLSMDDGVYLVVNAERKKDKDTVIKLKKVWDISGYTDKDIDATFEDGVLSVSLQKSEKDKSKKIQIK